MRILELRQAISAFLRYLLPALVALFLGVAGGWYWAYSNFTRLEQGTAIGWLMLGSEEKDTGNCDRAIAYLNRALCIEKQLDLEGFSVMPHLLLGECYALKGMTTLAIEEYETARVLLDPATWAGQQDIPKIDQRLEVLRKQLHDAK